MAESLALSGRTIALPETRSLDIFAGLLERRGAKTLRCPLIGIVDHADQAAVNSWLEQFIQSPPEWLICLTGEGLRRLTTRAESIGLLSDWKTQLAATRKITRGPKPRKVLKDLGIAIVDDHDLAATEPTSAGVIAALKSFSLSGADVGLQCYGDDPNPLITEFLQQQGANVRPVFPYQYQDASDDAAVQELIQAAIAGQIDALAFTSSPQITRLLKVAVATDQEPALRQSLSQICVAAVGPVVAEKLAKENIPASIQPDSSFFMKPLTQALCDHFQQKS